MSKANSVHNQCGDRDTDASGDRGAGRLSWQLCRESQREKKGTGGMEEGRKLHERRRDPGSVKGALWSGK